MHPNAGSYSEVVEAQKSWYGVYMRTTCSETWPHNENSQQVRDKCEKADLSVNVSNALSVTPVSTPDITYRNVYCALCNYHNVSEYVYWKPGIYCDDGTVGGEPLNGNVTLQNTEKNCSIAYFNQPTVTQRWLDPLRPCIAEKFVDECLPYNDLQNTSVGLTQNEYNCTAERCKSYADFLYTDDAPELQFFKNVECALCNGFDASSLRCTKQTIITGRCFLCTSFVALLDFSDSGQISFEYGGNKQVVTESCAKGQVYNPERMQCQDLVCPSNFELAGDVCKPSIPEKISLYFVIILFTNTSSEKLKNITSDGNIASFQNKLLAALLPLVVNGTVQQLNISLSNRTLHIQLVMNTVNDNYTIARTKAELDDVSLQFHYNGVLFQSSAVSIQIPTPIPTNNSLNCTAYIALNESEYQLLDNKSLLVIATNSLLNQSDYIISNGSVLRCNEFSQTFNRTVTVAKTWDYNTAFTILSVIGSVLLLLACISLLITYALFKELRTLPGKCIMSFAAAVAITQIIFAFGPGLTENSTVCTVMGVSLHFFVLSEFTWSSVLATDLIRTFVLMRTVHTLHKDSQLRTFLLYTLYAWGSPLIVCFIAVILDQHADINIDYASERICWLQPGMANLIAFGVPVALILVYNLLAFIALGLSIHRALKTGSMARNEMAEKSKTLSRIQQQFKVVLGSASLLSLSWIPAFLAAIEELEWLWYVFMVATILQGLLLFVVFVLNQKVRLLYKKKLLPQQTSDGQLKTKMTKISSAQQTPLGSPAHSMI